MDSTRAAARDVARRFGWNAQAERNGVRSEISEKLTGPLHRMKVFNLMTESRRIVHENFSIILYDGVCGFCNRFTAFVLARDEHNLFRFASLQSRFAGQILGKHGKTSNIETIYVIADVGEKSERVMCRSEAVLFILTRLRTTAALGRTLRIVPRRLSDWFYNLFARYRYALFGELKTCPLPSQAQKTKFIES
jgi:predicted DCC family thiol-disulfide oxidoreductase YuxK